MKKNKILYVITSLGIGGAEKLLLSYLKGFDHSKYEFYVCSLREKPDDLTQEISKFAEVINLKVKNRFNPFIILQISKLIREISPDIIHTHLFQSRVYGSMAHLFNRNSLLITQKHSVVNPGKHNIFIFFEMISILMNKGVIAISESVKNSLIKYEFIPEHKIFVIPNCIDYQTFASNSNPRSLKAKQEIVIGTVGRLEKIKGIEYLLLAMTIILTKFPNAILEIIGDGSQFNKLKEIAENLGISKSVKFLGKFVNVIPFYKRMDIFVLPSLLEGFGIVILEAMAMGLPIVATNVDGIKEVVVNGESGILVPPKNPKAIAEAITYLIEHPQISETLISEGKKRASLFDIQEHLMKLDILYSSLLRTKSTQ
jgi:glycosyltransferase involved in cell wall biosynthesis